MSPPLAFRLSSSFLATLAGIRLVQLAYRASILCHSENRHAQ
jgi:hypothetical protein